MNKVFYIMAIFAFIGLFLVSVSACQLKEKEVPIKPRTACSEKTMYRDIVTELKGVRKFYSSINLADFILTGMPKEQVIECLRQNGFNGKIFNKMGENGVEQLSIGIENKNPTKENYGFYTDYNATIYFYKKKVIKASASAIHHGL